MTKIRVRDRRAYWRAAYLDAHPNLGLLIEAPVNPYLSDEWRAIRAACRREFGAACYICGTNNGLQTAHIDYPSSGPGTEQVNLDLGQSDVVLLCDDHHKSLDGYTVEAQFGSVDHLRSAVLEAVELMRRGALG